MVRASHLKLVGQPGDERIADWLSALGADGTGPDAAILQGVLEWIAPRAADRTLRGGEPLLPHAVHTAAMLRGFRLDSESLAAGLLVHFVETREAVLAVRDKFGARVAELAEGAARMATIESLSTDGARAGEQAAQLEGLRKMLLAMAQDARVVLIKLADHTQTMRFVVRCDDAQARHDMARIALDIFAPLANRLGVWQLKWELEDFALRILEPQAYKRIAGLLDATRASREHFISSAVAFLREELTRTGVKADISGRPKHIYSIYLKMRRKHVDFEAIHDVHALRVLVDSVRDCYTVLGIAHSAWTALPQEFDDYIAKPKRNNYRSLHTAVMGPEGKPFEIQIRTVDMHQHAELGVAAHWRYKEGAQEGFRRDPGYDEKIAWLRQIAEWKDEVADGGQLAAQLRNGPFADTIYVLTPQGRVIDLPQDATPVDFAYRVHTDLGHRCRGARVNGAMVPLTTPLANGQQVDIVAAKQGGPSRDWLNPARGFLKSAGARAKVRQWFNRQNHEVSIVHGREVVEKELQRLGMTGVSLDRLAQQFDYDKLADFLADVGRGEIGPRQLQTALRAGEAPLVAADARPVVGKSRAQPGGILVVGVDKLLTVPARCCKPAPPDEIIGFVSRGRGVTIHRRRCSNVARLPAERLVAADWGTSVNATFPVDIVIEASDRTGLLRDITEILTRERVNVTATNSVSRDAAARMLLTLEVANLGALNRVLALIRDVPGVATAARR